MFKNAFTKDLLIFYSDGTTVSVEAIVCKEEYFVGENDLGEKVSNLTFVIDADTKIDIYDRISYKNRIFEIKSISLIESLDHKKSYYKLKIN